MQAITGHRQKKQLPECNNDFANELNNFYCRFDSQDFTQENDLLKDSLKINADHDIILIDEIDVNNMFSGLKINKASGPDSVGNIILKICSHQLSGIFTKIFQLTLDRGVIPQIWKPLH